MIFEPEVVVGSRGERFSASMKIYAPLVKGAGNQETCKYIALNEKALHLLGENNYHTGGMPVYEVGGEGKCTNCVAHVERDWLITSLNPTKPAMSAENLLKNEGFKQLNDVLIRLM